MSLKVKLQEGWEKFKTNRKIQIYVGTAAVLIIVAVGVGIIYNSHNKEKAPVVQTYVIPENEKIFINGLVVPKQSKEIMGPANGATPDIRVSNGQSVKTGDVLYIVKDEAAIQEIASIKTQISNLIREKSTLQTGDVGIVSINNQIATLNTSLSAANAKAYTKVKAPFDGKVYLHSSAGSSTEASASSGSLMTVQTTDYVMNGQISEQDLSKISKDMTADVTVLSTGDTLKGRISYISDRPASAAQPSGSAQDVGGGSLSFYNVVLAFDTQEGVVDGYHTQATIEVNSDKHKIPSSAILNSGEEVYVLADIEGVLKKVNIEVISEGNNYSVVTGDLNQNDVIIKNPTLQMKEGDPAPVSSGTDESEVDAKSDDKSEEM
ncbi:MAG: efflux RND transporter periplasmic adaptor subunit [Peptostreptococcus porci]|uniref:Efflux RND transporter periplasmic adaptor subunit n=1 Tax=Peptostreptococcus porci TaxID=2652282 RepID=A0A6N7XFA0_9FIRM|nr:efflux RND transporter periplasmic adaptor subunit [Peptostreptococcus porci]MDD7182983.1 efflux RND transporter periplasmic adaptor subunit [Peptostreptococcus porci]MDY5480403.1 efflux RND transporter periplasmic adaptor subunit [Peptostreptococcus porci]MDY6232212.1 efflux RND transporter periplasmic adaptor subunit [Peptostreptococcus porci]MST63042.1 efflux RND transporter periplasmic adaptor subunit [Peptostreptococcus porci]